MEKPHLPPPAPSKGGECANLSSKRMHTHPSTLFPYFSMNKGIREGGIIAIATKGAVGNKGFYTITSKSRRDDTLLTVDSPLWFSRRGKRNLRTTTRQEHRISSGMQPISLFVELLRSSGDGCIIKPRAALCLLGAIQIKPLLGFTGINEI